MLKRRNTKKITAFLLIWLALAPAAAARVVGIEDGAGSGFLFSHRGNCFLILPGHVHGNYRRGIRVGTQAGGAIGSADIVYQAPGEADISLALVKGGVTRDCGPVWADLPRSLSGALEIGRIAIIERARQRSAEGRRVVLHSIDFRQVRLVPAEREKPDLFGGTSGATVFLDSTPIAMVLEAEAADAVWATRMDEIVNLLARFMGEVPPVQSCGEGVLSAACAESRAPVEGDPFEVLAWSVHPVEGASDPSAMVAGGAPYVAPLVPGEPIVLELALTGTDRLSRVRIVSEPSDDASVPKDIEVMTDISEGAVRRPNPMPRRDMSPDGVYDNRVGERFAKTVTIRISSSWGGGSPVRIDRIVIE
ncbi:hypothetical protein SAMN04488105_1369 [Salipiger thiooxidans]|uniref:Trypsin-like peptidase domain-containing protein n=1 Tax=Salipiger thiooxidans TaxID=282683 RepID=A0A1G7MKC4_9RHOB|nr:hypothetical protein [Salipiger thiooxidans]SDF61550.1 hypothetical protein SAMN04488105_1369 [Salipiger thiooxidans]